MFLIPPRPEVPRFPWALPGTPVSEPPGPWWALTGETVTVCCPAGHTGLLDHDVAADGTVTPSLVCPGDGCTWHVNARLEGWKP